MKTTLILLFSLISLTVSAQVVTVQTKSNPVTFNLSAVYVKTTATEDQINQAFDQVRELIRASKPKHWRFYDIYIVTPKGTYYQNYSFRKRTVKIS